MNFMWAIFCLVVILCSSLIGEEVASSTPSALKKLSVEGATLTERGAIHTAVYTDRVTPQIELYKKTNNINYLIKARAYVQGILDLWNVSGRDASKMTRSEQGRSGHPIDLRPEFFHRAPMMESFSVMRDAGVLDETFQKDFQEMVENHFTAEERGPNNRSASFAIGCALAAKAFPNSSYAKQWRDYAEAVWEDWYGPGDTYEPCYILHHRRLIELGQTLGKVEELRGEKLRKTYDRYLSEISPSGLAVSAGDGITYDSVSYQKLMESIVEVCPTPEYLWGLKMTYLWKPGNTEESFYQKFPQYKDLESKAPAWKTHLSYRWPATSHRAERLILCPSWENGSPYAAFWLNDFSNYLYHGGVGDSRGDLIHYEVGGVLLIADRGRYDWPGWNNTFVVGEADAEYPFVQKQGINEKRWYRGSGDIRSLSVFSSSNIYIKESVATIKKGQVKEQNRFIDQLKPLGFMYGNPDGIEGKNNVIPLKSVSVEFAVLPPDGEKSLKVFPGRTWWGGYETRNVCPSASPVDVYISDLCIAGPKGEEVILPFDRIPEEMEVTITPPKGLKEPEFTAKRITGVEVQKIVRVETDPITGRNVIRVTTQQGRIRLDFKLPGKVYNFGKDYTRINLSYQYLSPIQNWVRTPIRLYLNNSDLHGSLMIDGQQGGFLTKEKAESYDGDGFGSVSYNAIWTYDSSWTRSTVLTKEGILVVRDEFKPGVSAKGLVGGPVWHLPQAPKSGFLRIVLCMSILCCLLMVMKKMEGNGLTPI